MAQAQPTETGTSDELYDLVSVLYHSLQGAETLGRYLEDCGDEELAREFRTFQAQYEEISGRAKELLRARLSEEEEKPGSGGGKRRIARPKAEDVVDEASIESFPASDAPAY